MVWILLLFLVLMLAASGVLGWGNFYFRQLNRDLSRWEAEGLISSQAVNTILARKQPKGLGQRLVYLVGFLGALLLLFSVVSFVAANWSEMSRLSKLTWLIALLWTAFLAGWRLMANNLPLLAEAAWALGVGLFGVNIALIAQMFHIDSHPPSGVLMWSVGALLTAALVGSRAALLATFVGAIGWSMMESLAYGALAHWPFLLLWGAALALAIFWRWAFAYHFALLSFLLWLITTLVRYSMHAAWQPHGLLALLVMLFLFLFVVSLVLQANEHEMNMDHFEVWLERYAIVGLIAASFALQTATLKLPVVTPHVWRDWLSGPFAWLPFALGLATATLLVLWIIWREELIEASDLLVMSLVAILALAFSLAGASGLLSAQTHEFVATWVYGAAFLALLIWFMSFGHRQSADIYVWTALLAFAGEVLYIYARIFGSLLETSLFFLIGGVLTLALAFLLYHMRKGFDDADENGDGQPPRPVAIPKPRPKPKPAPKPLAHNPLQRLEP